MLLTAKWRYGELFLEQAAGDCGPCGRGHHVGDPWSKIIKCFDRNYFVLCSGELLLYVDVQWYSPRI